MYTFALVYMQVGIVYVVLWAVAGGYRLALGLLEKQAVQLKDIGHLC